MKYYIATSNLNLDNILQSECILPFPHYGHRVSGYKTFEQIEELRPFSGVVLFAFPVSFEINDPGRYNFPLLIEFEDDIIKNLVILLCRAMPCGICPFLWRREKN